MYYFKVPKLGSYMAIKLEYQSCLFEEALDEGVKDRLLCMEKERAQDEERQIHQKAEQERKDQAEAEGEEFIPDKKQWEVIEPKPYKTRTVQFVCCLNSLGQDRKFTDDEKLFALRTV